jgi:dihydroorotate dehydrogenase
MSQTLENKAIKASVLYTIVRSILFLFDAEKVHYWAMNSLQFCINLPMLGKILSKTYAPKNAKPVKVLGLNFKNTVGLAAGFDKNAKYLKSLQALGFGFVEIGTVTPMPQAGNDAPRLFRLKKDGALINRMGFNNDGVNAAVERLKIWRSQQTDVIIGGNIGKNKITPNEDAWKDYEICFNALHDYVDYFVVNVSSPNTPGLRALQEKPALQKILTHLQQLNKTKAIQRPILLKIAPDLNLHELDDVIALALEIKLDGLVVSNTTIDKSNLKTEQTVIEKIGMGGLSGLPLFEKSTSMLEYIFKKTNGSICLIGSGGIFTATQNKAKHAAGATLTQVWTGFIYQGPAIVKKLLQ